MDQHTLLYIASAALILVGVIGVVLPALPGVPLVFAGMLLAAWTDSFRLIPIWVVALLAVLTALALVIDFLASVLGAKRIGASKLAIFGAAVGTVAGLFFSLPGLLLGPFIGALVGEWLHSRDVHHATRVGVGTWIGMLVGAIFKLMLTCAMLGVFVLAIVMHR